MPRARAAILVLAAGAALVPLPAALVERWYSRGLYPVLQRSVTALSNAVPIALLDVGVLLLLTALLAVFVRRWRQSGMVRAVGQSLLSAAVTAGVLYLWFVLSWGLNYRRVPLEQKLAFDPARIDRARALAFGAATVVRLNELVAARVAPTRDDDLARAVHDVQRHFDGPNRVRAASPKRSVLQWYFRAAAIDGMTDPFFLEVILNPDLLPFERPFVLAHELAHLAGYADESEASFVAWLACVRGTPPLRYSGWLSAYAQVASALPRDDRAALRAQLKPEVAADLSAAARRRLRSNARIRQAARGAYDTYLRANRIEEGIANYDVVVRLMLGTRFDDAWTPTQPAGQR